MKMYKVIALSVGGRRNKIFNSGDVVSEKDFPEGVAPQLVTKGFLAAIAESETPELVASTASVETAPVEKTEPGTPVKKTIEEISKSELKEALTAANVAFNPNASKNELYKLWMAI